MPNGTESGTTVYSKATVNYDKYYLSPIRVSQFLNDSIQNVVTTKIDYMVLQPMRMIDVNDNATELLFDPLGHVIVTSMYGTENGIKTGGMTLYPSGNTQPEFQLKRGSFNEVIKTPSNYLQGASTFFYYNLHAWLEKPGQPPCSISLTRNNYWKSPTKDKTPYCKIEIEYSNGFGEELEKKIKANPGISFIRDNNGKLVLDEQSHPVQEESQSRWQVSGRTVYNNKKKPFEQYLPYFINTPYFEDQKDIPCPPPTVTHYDPLGRVIRVDTPKGFFSKVEFTPWKETHYDENDTVLDSSYCKNNYPDKLSPNEKDAIDKAINCFNTPSIKVNNNKGNVFLEIKNNLGNVKKDAFKKIVEGKSVSSEEIWTALVSNGYCVVDSKHKNFTWLTNKFQPYTKGFELKLGNRFKDLIEPILKILIQNELTSYYQTDIIGRNIESIDPRIYYLNVSKDKKYFNFQYDYSMEGKGPLKVSSADAGISKSLNNIFDHPVWSWNARNYCQLIDYDGLQRKSKLRVKLVTETGPINSYDDFSLVEEFKYGELVSKAKSKNLIGQLYELKDLSGILINGQYSMQGDMLESTRQLVSNYKKPANWNKKVELEKELFKVSNSYNAVKQLIAQISPDKSIVTNTYNEAGKLFSVDVEFEDQIKQQIVRYIDYDAKDQRNSIQYGNGVLTKYHYENTTLRLKSIISTRIDRTLITQVQNLNYWYDPVGNITRTNDDTINDVYSKNQEVKALSNYCYDPIYQLVQASGRQHRGITANTYKNNSADGDFKQCVFGPPPSTNDAGKLENYQEHYTYDNSGNLVNKKHIADSDSWSMPTPVNETSNHLSGVDYDPSGNMRKLKINSQVDLSFNCCNNLVKAGIITRPDELDDCDYYLYDSEEQRTRKVSERMANGGATSSIEDKIYLGNYELKRNYTGSSEKGVDPDFERQTLRIMDDMTCVAIIHYVTKDKQHPDKEKTRQCRFQMSNNIGSISIELDVDAKLISYEEYFPYGGTSIITGKSRAEVNLKEYRYSGKERDDSTGLYYYGARYYIPWLGRWLKPDPAGAVDGMNLYAFVGGNPITRADNNGNWMYVPAIIGALTTAYTSYKIASEKGVGRNRVTCRDTWRWFIRSNDRKYRF